MLNESQQNLRDKHVLEHMELSVMQAQDWVSFYETHGPPESLKQWKHILTQRLNIFQGACQNEPDSSGSGTATAP